MENKGDRAFCYYWEPIGKWPGGRGSRMVMSPMTSRDYNVIVVTSQPTKCFFFDNSCRN